MSFSTFLAHVIAIASSRARVSLISFSSAFAGCVAHIQPRCGRRRGIWSWRERERERERERQRGLTVTVFDSRRPSTSKYLEDFISQGHPARAFAHSCSRGGGIESVI